MGTTERLLTQFLNHRGDFTHGCSWFLFLPESYVKILMPKRLERGGGDLGVHGVKLVPLQTKPKTTIRPSSCEVVPRKTSACLTLDSQPLELGMHVCGP